MTESIFIRVLVAIGLFLALFAFVSAPVPVDARGTPDLPAAAFEQLELYRMEVALLVFYCWLLLITPAFSGLIRGRLPVEISTRGARFADEADQAAERNETAIKELERGFDNLADGLTNATVEVERLKEQVTTRD
jgi:hypothetical protein